MDDPIEPGLQMGRVAIVLGVACFGVAALTGLHEQPGPLAALLAHFAPEPIASATPIAAAPVATPIRTAPAPTPAAPAAAATGTLSITFDGWGDVYVDGAKIREGASSLSAFPLPPGTHKIVVQQDAENRREMTVTIAAGKDTAIHVDL